MWNIPQNKTSSEKVFYLNKNETEKEPLYFIAFCSQTNISIMENNILIDGNNDLIKSIRTEYQREIKLMKNSISWKITHPLRFIKSKLSKLF